LISTLFSLSSSHMTPCFSTVEKTSLNKLRRKHWTRNAEGICLTPAVFFRGKYELRPTVKKLYHLRPKVSCISCVPSCQPQAWRVASAISKELYHLRPKVSASRVSVASRVVNPKHDELRPRLLRNCISCAPRCLLNAYLLCTESSTARVWVVSKGMGIQKSNNLKALTQFYCMHVTLYTIICTHTELLNEIDNV
jgi:hypothetical protein